MPSTCSRQLPSLMPACPHVRSFQPDKASPDVAVNDEHALMRFEFLEALVRLGERAA